MELFGVNVTLSQWVTGIGAVVTLIGLYWGAKAIKNGTTIKPALFLVAVGVTVAVFGVLVL